MSRPLISADDVRAARERRETRLVVPAGAIVTPLARDEAGRRGIELVEEVAGAASGRASRPDESPASSSAPTASRRRPHVPTCDDPGDPIEQIVARVMAQVPGADPEQVRQIATRVLERHQR